VTRDGGFAPLESPDGKVLYYVKSQTATSLWKIPLQGGQAIKVLDGLSDYLNLAIVPNGAYFVPMRNVARTRVFSYPGSSKIQFLDFETGQIRPVANFEKAIGVPGSRGPDCFSRWPLDSVYTDRSSRQRTDAGGKFPLILPRHGQRAKHKRD
jgi:hypothetical protein